MRSPRLPGPLLLLIVALMSVGVACSDGETDDRSGGPSPSGDVASMEPSPDEPSPKPDKKKPEKEEPRIVEVRGGATLTTPPDKAVEVCSQGPPLSRTCPTLVPLVRKTNYIVDSFGKPGGRFQVLELAAGAPADDFSRNSPPRVAHVVVEAGKPQFLVDIGTPSGPPVPLESVLGDHLEAPRPVSLKQSWGWNTTLVLAPSFPGGGAHGDHLVYRWKRGGIEYVLSLHAWSPPSEAVRTLHAIVRSIKH